MTKTIHIAFVARPEMVHRIDAAAHALQQQACGLQRISRSEVLRRALDAFCPPVPLRVRVRKAAIAPGCTKVA